MGFTHLSTSRSSIRSSRHSTRIPPRTRNNSTTRPSSPGDSHRRLTFAPVAGVAAGTASEAGPGEDRSTGLEGGLEEVRKPGEAVEGNHSPGWGLGCSNRG